MYGNRIPLDTYDIVPEAQRAYLMNYGKHFNEKMYRFAVSIMRNDEDESIEPVKKEDFEAKMKEHGVELKNNTMYDGAFVWCMAMSDFMGGSLEDERHVALYVKDLIDDHDQADGFIFQRFYADCMNKGVPIDWASML